MKLTRLFAGVAISVACVAALTACGDDSTSETSDGVTTTAAPAEPTISGAWARNSPMEVTKGAAYMTVAGGDVDDEIVSASVDAAIAETVELHETVMVESGDGSMGSTTVAGGMGSTTAAGDDTMSSTTLAPAMEMRQVKSIKVPAGEEVALKPGGFHIMFIDLKKPLVIGETFDMRVTFLESGEQTVSVEVKEAP